MDIKDDVQVQNNINLIKIFLSFLKIGITGFGPAMITEVKKDIVKKLKWINEQELLEGLALSQLIPGATFVSLTIYIGYKLKGLLGATVSFLGFILPSFSIVVALSWIYFRYQSIDFVNVLFKGLGVVVVALIFNTVWDLAKTTTNNIKTIIIAIAAFVIAVFYDNIFLILFVSALLGIVLLHNNSDYKKGSKVIEKNKIKWKDIVIVSITIIVFFIIIALNGKLFSMAGVFFRIGALVFGNGFTMLPLMQQEVVSIHHWLSLDQFLAGVALGQITPGPVSITAAFIGYKVMSLLGATVAALAIYSPSFLLVVTTFGFYKKIKNNRWVRSALTGLIASFVGLMALIVINMGRHALVDIYTIGLFVLSFVMLQFVKLDSKWVILGGSGVYLLMYYLVRAY